MHPFGAFRFVFRVNAEQNVTIVTLWHVALALDVKPAALLDDQLKED